MRQRNDTYTAFITLNTHFGTSSDKNVLCSSVRCPSGTATTVWKVLRNAWNCLRLSSRRKNALSLESGPVSLPFVYVRNLGGRKHDRERSEHLVKNGSIDP